MFACRCHRYHDGSPCENVYWRKAALEEVIFEALKQQIRISKMETRERSNAAKKQSNGIAAQFSGLRAQYDILEQENKFVQELEEILKIVIEEYHKGNRPHL